MLGGKVEMHVASLAKKKKKRKLFGIYNYHSLYNKNKVLFKVENIMDLKLQIA